MSNDFTYLEESGKDFLYVEETVQEVIEVTEASPGPKGDTGDKGDKGDQGDAGTIQIAATTTTPYGNPAQVTNTGTASSAVLTFVIPEGPQGEKGEKGDTSAASFVYEQVTPSTTWNINHNLGFRPAVTVVDSGGNDVVGSILYVDEDNVVVTFSTAFGGKAFLS